MKKSLFPEKQKYSVIDILKKGFLNIISPNENNKDNLEKSESIKIKEVGDEQGNNIERNVSINNYVNNGNEKINGGINHIDENKSNEKDETEISMTLNEETNINTNKEYKGHKKNLSTMPTKINQELIEKKISKETININNNIDIIKDNNSNSSNMTQENGGTNENKNNSVRVSDCSEKITNISLERKIPCFKTNFEEEINNIEIKKKKNYDNNS